MKTLTTCMILLAASSPFTMTLTIFFPLTVLNGTKETK